MTSVLDKPRVQCRYRDDQDRQCPLDALENAGTAAGSTCRSKWRQKPIHQQPPHRDLRLP